MEKQKIFLMLAFNISGDCNHLKPLKSQRKIFVCTQKNQDDVIYLQLTFLITVQRNYDQSPQNNVPRLRLARDPR